MEPRPYGLASKCSSTRSIYHGSDTASHRLTWYNSIVRVDKITSNKAVRCPIAKPGIVAVSFNDLTHDPIDQNKGARHHRACDSLPYILGYGPYSIITGNGIVEHLQQMAMMLGHSRKDLRGRSRNRFRIGVVF